MNRRDLIRQISLLTGATLVGAEFFMSGCTTSDRQAVGVFTAADVSFFDEVAETIIPQTDTPGAKEAKVGTFIAAFSTACYNEQQLRVLKEGIATLDRESEKTFHTGFVKATASQKEQLLTAINKVAKKYNSDSGDKPGYTPHYFTLMKQLTLLGFFTSKQGYTQVLRYVPAPGRYEGCIDYKTGDTSWA